MKFTFGDIVVCNGEDIGVVVKCWGAPIAGPNVGKKGSHYEVYVRVANGICQFDENEIERYMVRHKYLSEEEKEWQANAIVGI